MWDRWSTERDSWIHGLMSRGISREQAEREYADLGRMLQPRMAPRERSSGRWYAADWAGSKWIVVDPTNLMSLPAAPACYVVTVRGVVVYIGQTANLRKRFYEHKFRFGYSNNSILVPWGECVPIGDLAVKVRHSDRYGDWAMRELRLIRRLQPEQNCHGSTKKRRVVS
jgi:hypothetical protein